MNVEMAYGRGKLSIALPETSDVIASRPVPGLADEAAMILAALRDPIGTAPLRDKVKPGDKVVVSHSDITRPVPNARILPVLLGELEEVGVARADITLLNALGTHRPQTQAELRAMLGDEIVEHYRCLQHDAFDDKNLVSLGETSRGNSVRINKHLIEADARIYTGFIEPHFFAGFSGGPKAVLPALSGAESVFSNHGYAMINHPRATWGVVEGNPIWEEMKEMALRTDPTFLLNVTINTEHEITGVFAGDLLAAHAAGREFVRESVMVGVDAPYDIVVVSNSGYPLDQNLYQTVKGMSAAKRIVKQGGVIIMVAGCEDGLPDHGGYAKLLQRAGSPQGVLDMLTQPGFEEHDQWQIQIQAQIQLHADVYVYSEGLSDEQVTRALFKPCRDVVATVTALLEKYGPNTRLCAMPDGPMTIAYIKETERGGMIPAKEQPKKKIEVLGKRMAYVEMGAGDPIVFLHGNPTSAYLWRNVMPPLAHLGRCLAPDLIGMGDSDKLDDSGPGSYRFVEHRAYLDALLAALGVEDKVTFVIHDWGSALGFDWANRYRDRVHGIVYMEAIVRPLSWDEWPEPIRPLFQGFRSEAGEAMVLEKNVFVERVLPGSVLRGLTEDEMAVYRRPFVEPGEGRRPTLTWPRQIPLSGEPTDVVEIVQSYAAWMAQNDLPKLFVNAEPGAILTGPVREFCRSWQNQIEVTVRGSHFIQEDSPDEIGRAVADWSRGI